MKAVPRPSLEVVETERRPLLIGIDGFDTAEVRERLVTPIKNLSMSVRARNILVQLDVKYLGELVQLSRTEILGVSNAGKTTLAELTEIVEGYGFNLGTKIDGWTREVAADISKHLRDAIGKAAKERSNRILSNAGPEPSSLEQELHRVLRAFVSGRDSDALIKLWGWSGGDPRVLESVGQEYALTRERIRQIEKRAIERISIHKFEFPFLTNALKTIRQSVPAVESTISNELSKAGIAAGEFSVGGLKLAADMFGFRWPFEVVPLPGTRMLVDSGDAEKFRRAIMVLRRRTSIVALQACCH